jgi:hypothetical protein
MPLSLPDYDTLWTQVLAFFRNRFPNKDDHSESFIGKVARAVSMAIFGLLGAVASVDAESPPSQRTSSEGLKNWAFTFGVPSDTEGDFGPKGPTIATGGQGYCTGTLGTTFPDGALLTAPDGQTSIKLSDAVSIPGAPPGADKVLGNFIAVTPGPAGNLVAGTELAWESPPSGADSKVILTAPLQGALDAESDTSLLDRTLARMQSPPKGGTANDWRTWAESVDGVFRAYVYPLRGGMDTVHVVVATAGSGIARIPSATIGSSADAYVLASRSVTVEGYQVYLPRMVAPGMAIRVRVVPSPKFPFDWSTTNLSLTVAAYTPPGNAPATLTLSQAAPNDLIAAVARAATGLSSQFPRLQVIASGASAPAVSQLLACTAVNGAVLTLSSGPAAGIIKVGDPVFSGGSVVIPIATAELAYVDGLGPSRQSGYADPNDAWEDTCSIARLIQIALDLKDSTGAPLCRNVLPGGATIDGQAQDREATDNTGDPPELLYARSIAITD